MQRKMPIAGIWRVAEGNIYVLHRRVACGNIATMLSIEDLIERAGGAPQLASLAGVHRASINSWKRSGRVPAERARQVAEALDLPPSEVRPDLWPSPTGAV